MSCVTCPSCLGDGGWSEMHARCNGRGCIDCRNTGEVWGSCSRCNGTGLIPDYDSDISLEEFEK